jgi:hypothetical protein
LRRDGAKRYRQSAGLTRKKCDGQSERMHTVESVAGVRTAIVIFERAAQRVLAAHRANGSSLTWFQGRRLMVNPSKTSDQPYNITSSPITKPINHKPESGH